MSLLEVEAVNSYYGESHILFDVSLHVDEGEVVALLGRNGSGKTTTMNTIMGVVPPRSGHVRFAGEDITVEENLQLAAFSAKNAWTLERIYELFPALRARRTSMGRALSGGEQQMLAIGRALIRDARLLLLDEPFEGLAPLIVRDLIATTRLLAQEGRTIIIVEQNVRAALALAGRAYVLNKGAVVWDGLPAALQGEPELMHRYLGV
jgi:branched-chain amino acid transport system ATP-binding protein